MAYSNQEYIDYVNKYPDLVNKKPANMTVAEWGKHHWEKHGKEAGRLNPTRAKPSEWWTRTDDTGTGTGTSLEGATKYSDDQYLNYILGNPDLRETAEGLGLTQAEMITMGKQHWGVFGTDAGGKGSAGTRLNTPGSITYDAGFTETLGSQHFSGDDAAARLATILMNTPGVDASSWNLAANQNLDPNFSASTMWDTRVGLDPKWSLNTVNTQGWNMGSDNPYREGILGNTIDVDTGVGQIYDTGDN